MKPTIFCFINGTGFGGVIVVALAEDGEVLASHASSNDGWAKSDIGIHSTCKHDLYHKKYPDGFELKWLESPDSSPECLKAIQLNAAKAEEQTT
jgi:hypothetical protein